MKKFRFLVMAFTLLFAISIPTQVVAQNKKLIKKAENGSGEAQALLSTYYFKGIEGFDRDIEQAKFWAKEAETSAQKGSWEAQVWLVARLYQGDQLYRKDLDLAQKWADATLQNKDLKGEHRKAFVEYREKIVNEIKQKEKEKAFQAVSFGKNDNQAPSDEYCKEKCDKEISSLKKYCNNDGGGCYYELKNIFKLVEDGCTEAQNFIKSPRNYLSGDNKRIEEIENKIEEEKSSYEGRPQYQKKEFEQELSSLKYYCNDPRRAGVSGLHELIGRIFKLADDGGIEAQNFIKSPRKYLSGDNEQIERIESIIIDKIGTRERERFEKLTSKLDLANFFIIDSLAKNGNQRAQEYLNSSKRASDETFQNCLKYKNITPEEKSHVLRLKADRKKSLGRDAEILRLARYYAKLGDWYDVEKMLSGWTLTPENPLIEKWKPEVLRKRDADLCYTIGNRYKEAKTKDDAQKNAYLDSTDVWYAHAASFDAKNYQKVLQDFRTARDYEKKTGKDYFEEKDKQKQQDIKNQQQAYVNSLIKKYGKQYVTAASNGNTIIGMPEEVFLAYSSPVSRTLIEQTATTKIYRVSHTGLISGRTTYEYIWFKNGRVTRIKK